MAADAGWQVHMLDSTVIRAHACAAGARRSAGEQALGRSRGGFSTKLHLRADAHGRPVALHLTGGERHDLLGVEPLFEQAVLHAGKRGRPRWKPAAVVADKAYSAAWLVGAFRHKRIVPIIPNRVDPPHNPDFDCQTYRQRNLIERLVGKLKQFRRVATRCDKCANHYLAFIQIASLMIWLRSFGDATQCSAAAARLQPSEKEHEQPIGMARVQRRQLAGGQVNAAHTAGRHLSACA
jgi:transposase